MPDYDLQANLRDYHQTSTTTYDDARITMAVHQLDQAGGLSDILALRFDDLLLQNVMEAERERHQTLSSSDENKLYSFGQDHKIYSLSGILGDTALDHAITQQGHTWSGRSYREFVEFVEEEANIGACSENQRIVSLSYANRLVYGAFIAISGDFDANQPHMVPITAQFYVVAQERVIQEDSDDTDS